MKLSKILTVITVFFMSINLNATERVTLKAAKSSSSYYQMAVQMAENINKASNNQLSMTIEESQGSVQNLKEVRKRFANYMFTTPPVLIKLAKSKKLMFKNDNPKTYEKVRALFPIPYLTMHVVVRKDLGIKTFKDLEGKTLLIGRGSYGAREIRKYIKAFGLKNVNLIKAELSGAVATLKNGQIDGFATSGSYPAPNVIEAAASTDIRLLSMNDKQIKLTKRDKIIIPANTYSNVNTNTVTTTLPVGVYTTTNMSEDTAYKLTKAFWQSKSSLEKQNIWWEAITFKNLNMFKTKLHKGALKYYKEVNASVSKDLE
ncbi:TAXI family TRAP transporter solute-binding subunit [Arcobacter sp. CECT 8985]|uniref:TAXI family TRAP transporter solute-binding subunit n=1 Tax=Arcobacter sp. CECT 8985 TaxID=1935424 RepID=UPI00100A30B2|nr:TAXI family TRAP transporter solute-binding subunit [Arcobacter sp. CECT 8985]RXJ86637.1 TRAP transporter substrate-binding protein [Arcobacter sp. CECT 8985]